MTNNFLAVKIVAVLLLLLGSIIAGFIPLLLRKIANLYKKKYNSSAADDYINLIIKLLMAWSGGILLGGGTMHLLAEAAASIKENLNTLLPSDAAWVANYPWAILCCFSSVFLLHSLETLATACCATSSQSNKEQVPSEKYIDVSTPLLSPDCTSLYYADNDSMDKKQQTSSVWFKLKPFVSGLVIWFSLSLHSLFAGLAFGSEQNEKRLTILLLALVAHQFVEAFSLGAIIENAFGTTKLWLFTILIVVFSVALPGGIALGLVLVSVADSPAFQCIQSFILAFASGAFVQVALFEILLDHHNTEDHSKGEQHQHDKPTEKFQKSIKLVLFAIGFIIMSVLAML